MLNQFFVETRFKKIHNRELAFDARNCKLITSNSTKLHAIVRKKIIARYCKSITSNCPKLHAIACMKRIASHCIQEPHYRPLRISLEKKFWDIIKVISRTSLYFYTFQKKVLRHHQSNLLIRSLFLHFSKKKFWDITKVISRTARAMLAVKKSQSHLTKYV